MAARKPKERQPRKAPPDKKSNDRVVKRPARGYHRFRSGLLNVTPKGHEKEIVKSNQQSPLLCLPAEIRNTIWKYALGGKILRQVFSKACHLQFFPQPRERINTFALLRTCRQIYAESALFPFAENTFSVWHTGSLNRFLKRFRKHQLGQIKDLVFEMHCDLLHPLVVPLIFHDMPGTKIKTLPNLQRLRLCLFSRDGWKAQPFPDSEKIIRSHLEKHPLNDEYEIVLEKMEISMSKFKDNWNEENEVDEESEVG